jgi:hypothetical protein
MPVWGWILIAIGAVVVVAIVAWTLVAQQRTKRLQERFGPEYDRTLGGSKNRRDAESRLTAREKRHDQLDLRPLSHGARVRYQGQWKEVQSQFVDSPQAAVAAADALIQDVMRDRGYPVEDFEQRAADVSVEHPLVVENYREGHRLAQSTAAQSSADGTGSTEDLRQAMRHYRSLFVELTEPAPADEPTGRDRMSEEDEAASREHARR